MDSTPSKTKAPDALEKLTQVIRSAEASAKRQGRERGRRSEFYAQGDEDDQPSYIEVQVEQQREMMQEMRAEQQSLHQILLQLSEQVQTLAQPPKVEAQTKPSSDSQDRRASSAQTRSDQWTRRMSQPIYKGTPRRETIVTQAWGGQYHKLIDPNAEILTAETRETFRIAPLTEKTDILHQLDKLVRTISTVREDFASMFTDPSDGSHEVADLHRVTVLMKSLLKLESKNEAGYATHPYGIRAFELNEIHEPYDLVVYVEDTVRANAPVVLRDLRQRFLATCRKKGLNGPGLGNTFLTLEKIVKRILMLTENIDLCIDGYTWTVEIIKLVKNNPQAWKQENNYSSMLQEVDEISKKPLEVVYWEYARALQQTFHQLKARENDPDLVPNNTGGAQNPGKQQKQQGGNRRNNGQSGSVQGSVNKVNNDQTRGRRGLAPNTSNGSGRGGDAARQDEEANTCPICGKRHLFRFCRKYCRRCKHGHTDGTCPKGNPYFDSSK